MKRSLVLVLLAVAFNQSTAQLSLDAIGTPVKVDFDGFNGSGFSPTPSAGQLGSNNWAIAGFSDGNLAYGQTITTGDYARGTTNGGVTTGGIYSWRPLDSAALWIQPAASDFNPGTITLRAKNVSGQIINQITTSYEVYVLNDQNRSNNFNFSYSFDGVTFLAVSTLDVAIVEEKNDSLYHLKRSLVIDGLSFKIDSLLYFRWSSVDIGGSGARDEFGLDNISVTASVNAGCNKPVNPVAGSITSSSATISWDAVPEATKYKVNYRVQGTQQWTAKSATTNSKKLLGLLSSTTYQYKVKTVCANASSGFSSIKTFTTLPLKPDEYSSNFAITAYPNPSSGVFDLLVPEKYSLNRIAIKNALGQMVEELQLTSFSGKLTIDLNNYPGGLYFLQAEEGNGSIKLIKLVKD